MNTTPSFVYLSLGKLHHKEDGSKKTRVLESEFGNDIRDRMVRMQQKHSWKSGSGDLVGRNMLWGIDPSMDEAIHVQLTSVVALPDEKIGYVLETDSIGGYLTQELTDKSEH